MYFVEIKCFNCLLIDYKSKIMNSIHAINSPDWSDKTILIVDDLKNIFEYFKLAMSRTGVHMFWANSGKSAIEYVKKENSIHLVLMDIQMPGMDGYTAGAEIKKLRPELPVIVQTAYVLEESEQKALDKGLDGYIAKPIRINLLLNLLSRFLNS